MHNKTLNSSITQFILTSGMGLAFPRLFLNQSCVHWPASFLVASRNHCSLTCRAWNYIILQILLQKVCVWKFCISKKYFFLEQDSVFTSFEFPIIPNVMWCSHLVANTNATHNFSLLFFLCLNTHTHNTLDHEYHRNASKLTGTI